MSSTAKSNCAFFYGFEVCRKALALLWQFVELDNKLNGLSKEVFWRKPLIFRDFIERLPK